MKITTKGLVLIGALAVAAAGVYFLTATHQAQTTSLPIAGPATPEGEGGVTSGGRAPSDTGGPPAADGGSVGGGGRSADGTNGGGGADSGDGGNGRTADGPGSGGG
jgi:hypothetical protein